MGSKGENGVGPIPQSSGENNPPTLSLRQPYGWLVVNEYKDLENRSWRTNHRGVTTCPSREAELLCAEWAA